jgi:hypothetical protein
VIIVFARAPIAGKAKTRLASRLGEAGAARLQARLTRAAVRTALAARCGAVEVHGATRHRFFGTLGVRFRLQRGADLGERMRNALRRSLTQARRPAILIGSDCPELRAADLRRAERWLRAGYDAVLAPAEDGGYALVGLRRMVPGLFEGIAWGGMNVFTDSAARLAGRRWRALRIVWDVDRPQDLERLAALRFLTRRAR